MEKYLVSFTDEQLVMNDKELEEFINTAIINNKDIHNFTVNRLEVDDIDVDDEGKAKYLYDFKEYPDDMGTPAICNMLSALTMYALDTNRDNFFSAIEHMRDLSDQIPDKVVAEHFAALAIKIINSKL